MKKRNKFEKPVDDVIVPELQAVLNAIDNYIKVNNGNVCVFADLVAFDQNKIDLDLDDVIKEGSNRILVYGQKECLRISMDEIRNIIEDESDKTGFVNI